MWLDWMHDISRKLYRTFVDGIYCVALSGNRFGNGVKWWNHNSNMVVCWVFNSVKNWSKSSTSHCFRSSVRKYFPQIYFTFQLAHETALLDFSKLFCIDFCDLYKIHCILCSISVSTTIFESNILVEATPSYQQKILPEH